MPTCAHQHCTISQHCSLTEKSNADNEIYYRYVQSNGQTTILGRKNPVSAGRSTPPPLSANGLTIDETPVKTSKFTEAAEEIISGVANNAIQSLEDHQTRPPTASFSEVLDIIKEEGQRSQPEKRSPLIQGVTKDPQKEERMCPHSPPLQNLSRSSKLYGHSEQLRADANSGPVLDEEDEETTEAESGGEDNPRQHNGVKGLPQMNRSKKRLFSQTDEIDDAAALGSLQVDYSRAVEAEDTVMPHYLQNGAKRAKIGNSNNEESQDSMKSAVTLKRRPVTSPGRKASPKIEVSAPSRSNGRGSKVVGAPIGIASSLETTRSSLRDESTEPTSSFRSTRSAARQSFESSPSPKAGFKVVFASSVTVSQSKPIMRFLTTQGIRVVKDVADADILCVGKNAELKRTSNLISAVACGKDVISDNWITDSAKEGKLLGLQDYKAKDPEREAEWGANLDQAVERGRQGVKALSDWSICFTPKAKAKLGKGFSDLKKICLQAGAKSVQCSTPKKSPQQPTTTLVIAEENDKDLAPLHNNGWHPYTKELITYSVLRGTLDASSNEFSLAQQKPKLNGSAGKKRKR